MPLGPRRMTAAGILSWSSMFCQSCRAVKVTGGGAAALGSSGRAGAASRTSAASTMTREESAGTWGLLSADVQGPGINPDPGRGGVRGEFYGNPTVGEHAGSSTCGREAALPYWEDERARRLRRSETSPDI